MLRQILATGTILALSLAALACSGEDGPTPGEAPGPQPAAGTGAETQAQERAQAAALTRPERLDLTTTQPAPEAKTARTPATGAEQGPETKQAPGPTQPAKETAQPPAPAQSPGDGGQTPEANTPPPGPASPEDLIPEDPRTNDQVLLQDIYARMDLEQFALDPNEPIPRPARGQWGMEGSEYPDTRFGYFETRDHPYLHLFPGLLNNVNEARKEGYDTHKPDKTFEYNPYNPPGNWDGEAGEDYFFHGGITHFIYHPWFEPLRGEEMYGGYGEIFRVQNSDFHFPETGSGETRKLALGPHWFGSQSLRGTLAKAVTEGLEQARAAGVEDRPIPWRMNQMGRYTGRSEDRTYENKWSLEEYLRTPVFREKGVKYLEKRRRSSMNQYEIDILNDAYRMPTVHWEFLHPKLPIIRVTAYNKTVLPLAAPGQEQNETQFAVSFVVSFQNRWASFDDPNRWLVRFEEDLLDNFRLLLNERGADAVSEFHNQRFPNYWHESDYMQHRLIGPVVVQVYETNGENKVMEPGVYAVTPRVTEWETPGPILRDDRQLVINGDIRRRLEEGQPDYIEPFSGTRSMNIIERAGKAVRGKDGLTETNGRLRTRAIPASSNPGWPLPGHVMTNTATGPGTQRWETFQIDGHEW